MVLIPLLVDDPLWGKNREMIGKVNFVLIPLLVDDPLWVALYAVAFFIVSLNPSFSG